jgi:hypothetical protein
MKNRNADIKWGVKNTVEIPNLDVKDYSYTNEQFLNSVPGSEELRAYQNEAHTFARVDTTMNEGGAYDLVNLPSILNEEAGSLGGPQYVDVGLDEKLSYMASGGESPDTEQPLIVYNYPPASVEYY